MSANESPLRVLAFEAFFGASHQAFLEGLASNSRHQWRLLTLPARRWKQRMRSGAEPLAEKARAAGEDFDVVFATDMLDLARLRQLLPPRLAGLPTVLYFHENQLTYPVRFASDDHWRFGLVNVTGALAADRVVFNSEFHRRDFLEALPGFLEGLPPEAPRPENAPESIAARSSVARPGIDVAAIPMPERNARRLPLTILWNHRWEHDKRPEAFFAALEKLTAAGADFRAVVCGESFARRPEVFARAPELLGERLLHLGFAADREEYVGLLGRADLVVSTAAHEFFGIAWLEACAAGCMPLVPDRLSYPELVPAELHQQCVYTEDASFFQRLRELCADPRGVRARAAQWRGISEPYSWPRAAATVDALLESLRS